MLVFWKARLVLIAVPKTGTTAVESVLAPMADAAILNPPRLKHCPVMRYRRHLAPFFERGGARPMEVVAVMREPVAWLGSWYRYRSRPTLQHRRLSTAKMEFGTFVDGYVADPQPDFARVGSQAAVLAGGVDHLFRHDRMEAYLTFLRERLEVEIMPPRANVSPDRSLELSPARLTRLREKLSDDLALWDELSRR